MPRDVIQKVKEISAAATFAIGIVDRIAIQPGGAHHRADVASGLQRHRRRGRQDAVRAVRGPRRASAGRRGRRGRGHRAARHRRAPAPGDRVADPAPDSDTDRDAECVGRGDRDRRTDPDADPDTDPQADPQADADASADHERSLPRRRRARRASSRTAASRSASNRGRSSWRRVRRERSSGPLPDHFAGSASAMVSVTGPIGAPSAVSVEQGGLTLTNGVTYTVSMAVRSTATRELRVRLSTPLGEVIASQRPPGDHDVDRGLVPGDAHRQLPGRDLAHRSRCVGSTNLAGRRLPGLTPLRRRCIVA